MPNVSELRQVHCVLWPHFSTSPVYLLAFDLVKAVLGFGASPSIEVMLLLTESFLPRLNRFVPSSEVNFSLFYTVRGRWLLFFVVVLVLVSP